jgi:hypothetical protein
MNLDVEKSTPISDSGSESEVDELMDTDDSNSSDSEEGVRAGHVRTTMENKQRKKRLAKTTLPESPSDGFQELDEEDDIHSIYGKCQFLLATPMCRRLIVLLCTCRSITSSYFDSGQYY